MATNRPRYTVSVDEEMFQQIEDFRFANRYPTRSDATVELIRMGLAALEKEGVFTEERMQELRARVDADIANAERIRQCDGQQKHDK